MCLWHHEEQQILILPFWGRAQVEGTSEGVKFWWFLHTIQPSLLEACSTRTCPAATHTSVSLCWSLSITVGFSPSALWEAPMVAQSRTACVASGPRWVVIWLNASATALSCPFWYSNWKCNFARAPTHQWPVVSNWGLSWCMLRDYYQFLPRKVGKIDILWNVPWQPISMPETLT